MPYTVNLNLATRVGADWLKGAVCDFFSEDFEGKMEAACQQLCGPRCSDPWLLDYFTDNELRWGADRRGKLSLLEEYLGFPEGAAGRQPCSSSRRDTPTSPCSIGPGEQASQIGTN